MLSWYLLYSFFQAFLEKYMYVLSGRLYLLLSTISMKSLSNFPFKGVFLHLPQLAVHTSYVFILKTI